MAYKFNQSPEGHHANLALFAAKAVDTGTERISWEEFRPVSQVSAGAPLEFNISGTGMDYIDLKRTKLHVKARIVKLDGSALGDEDKVGFVNLPLQSLWRQVDVQLQQLSISPTVSTNYAYKAMIDVLLNFSEDSKESQLQSQLYFKDTAGFMDVTDPARGGNMGLQQRSVLTKKSAIVDLEGSIYSDIFQQDRLLINGIQMNIKFFPSSDAFRLMSANETYRVEICDSILKLCKVKVSPGILVGHNEALKHTNALYPFMKTDFKTYSISKDLLVWSADDPFLGQVPKRLIVCLVPSEAYSGCVSRNPFNFINANVNFIGFYVDGTPRPSVPFTPNYKNGNFVAEYLSMFQGTGRYGEDTGNFISRSCFGSGYAFYVFDLESNHKKDIESLSKKGHTRLSIQFSEGLKEATTVLLYAQFQSIMQIDISRNVFVN